MLPSVTRTARDSENNCFPFFKNGDTTAQTSEQPRQSRGETPTGRGVGGAETAPLPRAAGRSGEAQTRGGSPGRRTAGCRAGVRDPPESGLCRRFEAHVNPGEDGLSLHPSPSLTAITRIRPQDVAPPETPRCGWPAVAASRVPAAFPQGERWEAGAPGHSRTDGQAGVARTRLRRGAGGQGSRGGVGVPRRSPGPLSLLGPRRRRETLALVAATSPTP